jgi:hypothetical protein
MRTRGMAAAIAAFLLMTGSALAGSVTFGQQVRTSDLTDTSPLPPTDVYRPTPSRGATHFDLATFAWLEFIALNAPADLPTRGVPGGSFADSGMDQSATLVWETYQHRSELFPFNPSTPTPTLPQPFTDPPTYDFEVGGVAYNPTDSDISPPAPYNNLDEVSQIGQNLIFFPGEPDPYQILFQAKVNEVERDYVAANYMDLDPPLLLDNNSIEVKSAWVPIEAIPDNERYRYHTSEVIYYTGDENDSIEAHTGTFALLGLHIIQKTPNYPAFIFATFEHTDIVKHHPFFNKATDAFYVPVYDDIQYLIEAQTTLNGLSMTVDNPNIHFNVNRPRAYPNGLPVRLPVGPVTSIPGATVDNDDVLVPVVQPPTTNFAVALTNWHVHRAMRRIPGFDQSFVWQYYKLKGVQGVPTSHDWEKDFYLANIVIESSQPGVQLFRGGFSINKDNPNDVVLMNTRNQTNVVDAAQGNAGFSMGGCQGCHGVAQTQAGTDFSFLFGARDGKGFSPDVVDPDPPPNVESDRIENYAVQVLAP